MRYHNITKDDMLNGDGLRVVLWVSGCSHCCKECQNPVTWDPNSGILFDESAKQEIFEQLEKAYISGITFSGGDPLYVQNISEVTKLAKEIKEKYPSKTIWLYTGALWESLQGEEILNYLDVLVAPFEPAHALLRSPVGKAIWHRVAVCLLLKSVVTDCMSCIHGFLDITDIQKVSVLNGAGPDTC